MHLRTVSGEHVSYVYGDKVEVHKAIPREHSEPRLTTGQGQQDQAKRILNAKLTHGSAKALASAITAYGLDALRSMDPQVLLKTLALEDDEAAIVSKLALLENYDIKLSADELDREKFFGYLIKEECVSMLKVLLELPGDPFDSVLIDTIEKRALEQSFDVDEKFQALCQEDSSLRDTVIRRLLAIAQKRQTGHMTTYVSLCGSPYLEQLVFDASVEHLPDALQRSVRRHSSTGDSEVRARWKHYAIFYPLLTLMQSSLHASLLESTKDLSEAQALLDLAQSMDNASEIMGGLNTVFSRAIQEGRYDVAELLVKYGFGPESPYLGIGSMSMRSMITADAESMKDMKAFFEKQGFKF